MPQMAPMSWLLMYLLFTSTLITIIMMTYPSMINSTLKVSKILSQNFNTLKW